MEMEIRGSTVEVSGYVNAVGRESRPMHDGEGYFTEVMEPGVFARALERGGGRPMLLNHDPARVLATEGDGLSLREDSVGLFARATVSDEEVAESARKGELRGWSFGFRPIAQRCEERDGMRRRTVLELDLCEVSLIDRRKLPAYAATSVFTRDAEEGPVEYRVMELQDVEARVANDAEPQEPDLAYYRAAVERLSAVRH